VFYAYDGRNILNQNAGTTSNESYARKTRVNYVGAFLIEKEKLKII
jgi:hypothetical protein